MARIFRVRVLLFLLLSGLQPAFSQVYNLEALPQGFSFRAIGGYKDYSPQYFTITLTGQESNEFYFDLVTVQDGGVGGLIETTLFGGLFQDFDGSVLSANQIFPRDCAPALDKCGTPDTDDLQPYPQGRFIRVNGRIWIFDTYYIKDEAANEPIYRTCMTFDEFGFWQDFVRVSERHGRGAWGARTEPKLNDILSSRIERLWEVCEQELVS